MGSLPIPARIFFDDFASDVLEYNVLNQGALVGTYHGLSNSDEGGDYIGFLVSEQPKIIVGNMLRTVDGLDSYKVQRISYDRYEGKPELLKAYY